jgi:type II secretory pathway component PulF
MQNRLLQIVSWGGTLLALSYFGWTYWHLVRVTKIFGDMFSSMGIELPALTLFVISSRGWLYPILFLGLGALVVIKDS